MGERQARNDEMERLLEALVGLRSAEEARAFLHDLCTPREIEDLSQRLEVARLLAGGTSYVDVSAATGASAAEMVK